MAPDPSVATRIRAALAQHLKKDVNKIGLDDDLRKDLGLDSLAMIELLFKIEEAFDLEIPNEDLSQITKVGDVIAYVERRLGVTGSKTATAASAPAPARPVAAVSAAPKVEGPAKVAAGPKVGATAKVGAAAKVAAGAKVGAAAKVAAASKRPAARKKGSARA
jgi:acyl carrier protein